MKVVIPVAGIGSRLKPHTFTTPKPLMEVAGKPILDHIIEDVLKLNPTEIIFVVGYKRNSIKEHVQKYYSELNCRFVVQRVRDGDGSAVRLALEELKEDDELLVVFGDTVRDCDLKKDILKNKNSDSIIFGIEVEDPRHFGVMNLKSDSTIYEVEEKPENPKSNLAITGTYYFKSAMLVKTLLDDTYKKQETVKGEYRIIQVIEKLIKKKDFTMKASKFKAWYDCGRIETLLEANRYFLEKQSKGKVIVKGNSVIIPPSFVAKSAVVENSVIGPYAAIGEDVHITDSVIKNSVVSRRSDISEIVLQDSLISKEVILIGKASKYNVGEKSEISLN